MAPQKSDHTSDQFDPSAKAVDYLNASLGDDVSSDDVRIVDEKLKHDIPVSEEGSVQSDELPAVEPSLVDIGTARSEAQILEQNTGRQHARVLFVTQDDSVLHEGSPAHTRMVDLRSVFAEVHILLLNYKTPEDIPVSRLFENVWLYATQSTSWWKLSFDAFKLAKKQLEFSGGFRADIIVAEDPCESGLTACFLGKKYRRRVQLHVYDDFFDEEYAAAHDHPTLCTWSIRYVLNHVGSVRAKTEFQRQEAIDMNATLAEDAEILPSYYNLSAWDDFAPTMNLHERYPQFKFIILHVSLMQKNSHSSEVLLSASPVLRRYPTVGLVVVGHGPLRTQLEKQAIALGLQKNIEFEPMPAEILSHLKSANVLVHLSEDGSEDDVIMSAASVRLPMVLNKEGIAGKLFTNGESALLCDPADIACVTDSINRYLNENHERTQFAINAHDVVFERVEQDYIGYIEAYASSIERSLSTEG